MMRIRVRPDASFDVWNGQRRVIGGATSRVFYRDADRDQRSLRVSVQDGDTLRATDENLEMIWRWEHDSMFVQVRNRGTRPIHLERIEVLSCDTKRGGQLDLGRASELAYLQHGWQSWSPVRVRPLAAPDDSFAEDDFAEKHLPHGAFALGEAKSEWFTIIKRRGEASGALLGFVTAADQLAEIRMETAGEAMLSLSAICFGDGAQLDPTQTLDSEKLWLGSGEAGALVDEYAERLGRAMHARTTMPALTGWCSWYFFTTEIGEEELAANLARIRAERLPLKLILIDDGYQTAVGDWLRVRAERFPRGMRAAVDEIRAGGMIPGIWLAPFGARYDSELAMEHPEFLLRDDSGEPVHTWHHQWEKIYALDLTQPGVQDYLRQVFRTVCFEWGFDLLKLDFIFAGAAPGIHHDPAVTRAQAYRRGLQIIRDTIGEDKWILGCGAPQALSVGLVDAMRVGQDVSFAWKPLSPDPSAPAVSQAMQNCIQRVPFNRRLWVNDPDCVILRTRGHASLLSVNEMRTLATVVALTGEMILDGDNLATLSASQLDFFRRILPPLDKLPAARDLFENASLPPQLLDLELRREWGEWKIVAAINWTARKRDIRVDLPGDDAYHTFDFWQKKYLGVNRKAITLAQPPHATNVLVLTPTGAEPNLIASTFHLASGYMEVKKLERSPDRLCVELEKAGRQKGELVFAIPSAWENMRVRVNSSRAHARGIAEGVIAVRVNLDERAEVEVEGRREESGEVEKEAWSLH